MDVILEPRQGQIPIGSLKEPGVRLRMPNQTVPHGLYVVVLAERDQSFGLRPVPGVLLRVHRPRLHRVFGRNDVELRFDEVQFSRREFVRRAEVQRRADEEHILARFPQ